jgi:hypothetical protein
MRRIKSITVIIFSLLLSLAAFGQEVQPSPVPSPETVQPKAEGTIRIGVVTVKTQLRQDATGGESSEIFRSRWVSFLDGPTVELVPIEARVPMQINLEAEQKGCDYILYSKITQKMKTGFLSKVVKIAVPVLANSIPVGTGAMSGSISDSIKNSIKEGGKDAAKNMANEAAGKITAKDQVTLEFSLIKVNEKNPTLAKSLKAKAKSDGEDIFSPLLEQASEMIITQAFTKN